MTEENVRSDSLSDMASGAHAAGTGSSYIDMVFTWAAGVHMGKLATR